MNFSDAAEVVVTALDRYYCESVRAEKPVINQEPLVNIISSLKLAELIEGDGLEREELIEFVSKYLNLTTRLHHPAFLAHQVAPPHYTGSLGSLIDGFTNNAMAIYEMGPAASSIEFFLINWMLQKIGWQPARLEAPLTEAPGEYGGGVLTHGGSIANLTALIAARSKLAPDVWKEGNPDGLALLIPSGCHYSIARAAGIIGIGQNALYYLDVDERGAVRPDRLPAVFKRLTADGRKAVALVANGCSTAVGIYDPLAEIAEFCGGNNIWLHVDGAHGASVLLSEKYRGLMAGIKQADSLTWDAHKLMQTPTLCAALLMREGRNLDGAFEQEASYIFHEKEQPGIDIINRTVECTKAGLGLRLFMVMAGLGEKRMAASIDDLIAITESAHSFIRQQKDLECPVAPESNILCFRTPGSDTLQLKIRDRLINGGKYYLSTTMFRGRRYLRLVFMNSNTDLATVAALVAEIRQIRVEIAAEDGVADF